MFGLKEIGPQKDGFSFSAASASMEIYAVLRLVKGSTGRPLAAAGHAAKSHPDGSVVTNPKKIESTKSHSGGYSTSSGGGGLAGSGASTNSLIGLGGGQGSAQGGAGAMAVAAMGANATEFPWREQTVLRFPLPEGVLSLTPDRE
jgi:hypothetical protein